MGKKRGRPYRKGIKRKYHGRVSRGTKIHTNKFGKMYVKPSASTKKHKKIWVHY